MKIFLKKRTFLLLLELTNDGEPSCCKSATQRLSTKTTKNTFCLSHVMLVFLFCFCLHCFLFLIFSFLANYQSFVHYLPRSFCFCSYWWGFGSFVVCSTMAFSTKVMWVLPTIGTAVSHASSSTLSCSCDVPLIVVAILKSMLPIFFLNAQKGKREQMWKHIMTLVII